MSYPTLMNVYNRFDVTFTHGKGVHLYDKNNKEYFDAGSGIAVNSFGHCHPKIISALKEQSDKLWHISNLYTSDIQLKFSNILCENSFADKVFFTNSGAEAIECALKTARRFHHHNNNPHKKRIITFEGAFHGRTHLCISSTGTKDGEGYGTMSPDFDIIPLGDIDLLEKTITDETAAILIEPILGEGGIKILSKDYLSNIRKICDQNNILLICDEIQSGMGRTGKLFSFEYSEITPDICTSAKGIAAGFPLGACLATDKAASGMTHGTHGSTYGGNPLACAVGYAAVKMILEDGFLDNVTESGICLKKGLTNIDAKYDIIDEIRAEGLMIGLKINSNHKARDIASHLLSHGVIVIPAGDNVIRILPPLIISKDECMILLNKLEIAFEDL